MLDIVKAILVAGEVIISLLLVAIILIQKTKSEGLGLAFGSGMGETLFGSRAGNVLTKLTVILCIVFLVNTLFLSLTFTRSRGTSLMGAAAQSAMPVRAGGGAPQRSAQPAAPAPTAPGVAPTLPGTLGEAGAAAPAVQAESATPAAESAPAPAAEPVPAQ